MIRALILLACLAVGGCKPAPVEKPDPERQIVRICAFDQTITQDAQGHLFYERFDKRWDATYHLSTPIAAGAALDDICAVKP